MTTGSSHSVRVNEHVRLKIDIPNQGLHSGESGVVCSIWSFDGDAYEVEFRDEYRDPIRVLLQENQIEAEAST